MLGGGGEEGAGWNLHCVLKPPQDKTKEQTSAPNKDSDQPGHPPSLIRLFAVRMKKV